MDPRKLAPSPDSRGALATETLYGRLTDEDVTSIQARLEPSDRALWDAAGPIDRKRLALSFGLHYGVDGISERTGLSAAAPPVSVHSMTHGSTVEVGGSYYLADLVLDELSSVGRLLAAGDHALDFSCSSGRVLRPLAAALPEVKWHGCDPNGDAVAWVQSHLPEGEFFVSNTNPPLPAADATFALVYAMSIWSHFSEPAAVRWLAEMHRAVAPGGHLVLTTHGLQACSWFSQNRDPGIERKLGPAWIPTTAQRLQQDGHCFWDVFGEQGDWGVVDIEWGLAFFTPEWLLATSTPDWAVSHYRIGGAYANQDVYLLERR